VCIAFERVSDLKAILPRSRIANSEHGIELKLGREISSVDAKRKRLILKSGGESGFDQLIVATGARPRTLDIPGAKLRNVHYLLSLDDSKAIRLFAEGIKRVVAMVLSEDRIWKRFFSPQMSSFFESYYSARGVQFVKSATVTELRGDMAVNSVVLASGKAIACEMVVVGVGVFPATDMLADSGIELADGVLVNEYLETNQTGIYAAGDVANYQDVLFGKRRRVEHWDNAVSQGQYCAHALMGERTPFKHVPYFFSDVFDLSYEYWGGSSGAEQIIHRGDLSGKSFSVWWLREKRVVAAFTMNRPDEERDAAPKWIEGRQQVSAAKLENASQSISTAVE